MASRNLANTTNKFVAKHLLVALATCHILQIYPEFTKYPQFYQFSSPPLKLNHVKNNQNKVTKSKTENHSQNKATQHPYPPRMPSPRNLRILQRNENISSVTPKS